MKYWIILSSVWLGFLSTSWSEDWSSFQIFLTADKPKVPVCFIVTNPQGQRYGQLLDTGSYITEIKEASYGVEGLPDGDNTDPKNIHYWNDHPSAGLYTLTIYGLAASTYSFNVVTTDSNNQGNSLKTQNPEDKVYDLLLAGKTAEFKIDYDPTPGGKRTSLEKVVTFDTLKQDLEAAKALKTVKSETVFKRLFKKIQQAQKQSPTQQKKTLESLLQDIWSETGEQIHPQIAAILQQDIQTFLKTLAAPIH